MPIRCLAYLAFRAPMLLVIPSCTVHFVGMHEARAQCLSTVLAPTQIDELDHMGFSIALSSEHIAIGTPGFDGNRFFTGSVLLYDNNGDIVQPRGNLIDPDGQTDDAFGLSVGLSNGVLIAGAPDVDGPPPWQDYGEAHIFRLMNGTWEPEQVLQADIGAHGDHFGIVVGIDGDVAIVGSHGDDDACPSNPNCNSGSVYVFRYDGSQWVQETKLHAADAAEYDLFGSAAAIDGDVIIVGAHEDENPNGFAAGSAYVFRYDGKNWNQEAQLFAPAGDYSYNLMGYSVAIDGDWAVVGAPQIELRSAGIAHVFHHDGVQWLYVQTLVPPNGDWEDHFGRDVVIDNGTIIIGARGDDDLALDAGAAYVYRLDQVSGTWNLYVKLLADGPGAGSGDHFGDGVAVRGTTALVGAPRNDANGIDSGAAYLFNLTSCNPLPGDVTFNGVVDVDDLLAIINGWGFCSPASACWSDLDGDGSVNVSDLLAVIENWTK